MSILNLRGNSVYTLHGPAAFCSSHPLLETVGNYHLRDHQRIGGLVGMACTANFAKIGPHIGMIYYLNVPPSHLMAGAPMNFNIFTGLGVPSPNWSWDAVEVCRLEGGVSVETLGSRFNQGIVLSATSTQYTMFVSVNRAEMTNSTTVAVVLSFLVPDAATLSLFAPTNSVELAVDNVAMDPSFNDTRGRPNFRSWSPDEQMAAGYSA